MGKVQAIKATFNANGVQTIRAFNGIASGARFIKGSATSWKATLKDAHGFDVLNDTANGSAVSADASKSGVDLAWAPVASSQLTLTVTDYTGTNTTPGEVILYIKEAD